jgi:4-amino-4-deoxy-L-arabinose transferase-like glycosyltransferase
LLALLLRVWLFGDPIIHVDEEFYFLTGGRMLHGNLPYVDIWDRKPVGLFLIYAFAYAAAGGHVIGYQLLATASAAATAIVIRSIALRVAGSTSAWIAAAAYLLYLPIFNGAGGQSPVFYNLPMSLAALLLVRIAEDQHRPIRARGAMAMVLVGLAIQIKYTAVFEGLFFGLWLVWTDWKRGNRPIALVVNALVWSSLALLPTALALASYAALGHAQEFVQANFLSVMTRHEPVGPSVRRLFWAVVDMSPLLLSVAVARARLTQLSQGRLLLGWAATAGSAYLAFGNYYDHYALPLLPPFCAVAAAGLDGPRARRYLAPTLLIVSFAIGTFTAVRHWLEIGSAKDIDRMTEVIRPHVRGCIFIFEGHAILYDRTRACFVTRYVFPYHLSAQKEAGALGVDVMAELRRVRAAAPSVVVIASRPRSQSNETSRQFVLAMLRDDYRFVASVPAGREEWLVYERRTSPSPAERRVPAL